MAILKVANIHFDAAGTTLIRANGANTLTFNTSNGEDVRIDAAGNVLIGRTDSTVGNNVKLDVNGGINASAVLVNGASILATSNTYTQAVGTAGNAYATAVGTAGNAYATAVGTAGNNYTITVGAAANGWSNTISSTRADASNAYATAVGTAGNAYATAVGTAGNNYTITVGAAANGWANTISSTRVDASNAYAREVGTAGNNYTITVGAAANGWSNTKLSNTSGISFNGNLTVPGEFTVGGNLNFDTITATRIWEPAANTLAIITTQTERTRIDAAGNVLIGRTDSTVGNNVKLDVNGAINASAVLVNGAPLQTTTLTSNVVIAVADNSNAALRITQTGTGEAIRVEDSSNPDATPFVVDASGNVGIGITSPVYHIDAFAASGGVTGSFRTNGTTGSDYGNIQAVASGYFSNFIQYGSGLSLVATTGTQFTVQTNSTSPITFVTNLVERMRIDPTGNLLIGRTDSTVGQGIRLDVNGGINASAVLVNGSPISGGATIFTDSVNATRYVVFDDATSGTMTQANVSTSLTFNPSTGTLSSTIFNSTSDEILKYDVKPIENPFAYLDEFNGVHFKWKKTNEPSLGVIAQDVEKVLPELVDSGIDHKTVNYNGLIAVLIQAVKELKAEIEVLKNK